MSVEQRVGQLEDDFETVDPERSRGVEAIADQRGSARRISP